MPHSDTCFCMACMGYEDRKPTPAPVPAPKPTTEADAWREAARADLAD